MATRLFHQNFVMSHVYKHDTEIRSRNCYISCDLPALKIIGLYEINSAKAKDLSVPTLSCLYDARQSGFWDLLPNKVKQMDENSACLVKQPVISCQVFFRGKVCEFPVILSSLKNLQIKLVKLIYTVKYAKAVAKYSMLISALHSRLTMNSESIKPV